MKFKNRQYASVVTVIRIAAMTEKGQKGSWRPSALFLQLVAD